MADSGGQESFSLDEALRLLESGDVDRAIKILQRYLRVSPDSFTAHLKLAQAYQKKAADGDRMLWKLAERECASAMRLVPPDEEAHRTMIEIAMKLGLRDILLAQYETKYRSLPFAGNCIAMIRSMSPDYAAEFLGKIAAFVKANVVLLIIAGVLIGGYWHFTHRKPGAAGSGRDFTLNDLSGEKVTLSSCQGRKVVVLDFFATWCPPCRQSLPALHNLREKYLASDVEFFNVDLREDAETVRKYIESQSLSLHVLLDSEGSVARAYDVRNIPNLFVLDREGKVRHHKIGWAPGMETELEDVIKSLL